MPARAHLRHPLQPAFTLIELLVVVAIIALLIAILVPALGRAKGIARDTVCKSNARQMALGFLTYASSYNNFTPPATELPDKTLDPTGQTSPTWHVRIWDFIMTRPYSINDMSSPYTYLVGTIFECPQAIYKNPFSDTDGYITTDHRDNGYAMNISTSGTIAGTGGRPDVPPINNLSTANDESVRCQEYKFINSIRNPSATMMLTDAQGFYCEYFDRGATLNQIGVPNGSLSNAGKMLNAVARHGAKHDTWNMAFFDGSARTMQFNDVPGTPSQYYDLNNELSPGKLLINPSVSADTKNFWLGQLP